MHWYHAIDEMTRRAWRSPGDEGFAALSQNTSNGGAYEFLSAEILLNAFVR